MGFEITYKFYEKAENGYDVENIHEMKKKVGKAYDDTSYERLAATIMGQFARRDIMVIDVEITEFVKKQISFRETKNGICIKNKKYLFDGTDIEIQAVVEAEAAPAVAAMQEADAENRNPPPHRNSHLVETAISIAKNKKPIRYEVFEPEQVMAVDAKKRGLKFTRGNKYPIYEEKQDRRGIMYGMLYTTIDDAGLKQILSDRLFVFKQDLVGGSQFDDKSSVGLDYGPGVVPNSNNPIYGK